MDRGRAIGRRATTGAAILATALLAVGSGSASAPAGVGGASEDAAEQACTPAREIPADRSDAVRAELTVVCLVNRRRAEAGLAPLRPDRCLAIAAERHARDMVARRYFAHVAPEGRDHVDRIRAAGYLPRAGRWRLGENIAWGASPYGAPAWVVRAWMRSPSHRANLLGDYRDVGIGAVPAVPSRKRDRAEAPRATYVAAFGVHDGQRRDCA